MNVDKGKYYWVKHSIEDSYEPALACDHFNNGDTYFKFTDGSVAESTTVCDIKTMLLPDRVESLKNKNKEMKTLLRKIEIESRGTGNGVNLYLYNKILDVLK